MSISDLMEMLECDPMYEYDTSDEWDEERKAWCEEHADAHNCRDNASWYGICRVCGAIIHGSPADYDIHGYDPPDE